MSTVLRIGFLGSSGSFSEQAAREHARRQGCVAELLGAPEPATVLALVASGAVERCVLPVANSSAGLVWPTLAALGGCSFALLDEVVLPVRLALFAARAELGLEDIERVASHPVALRQCARALERLLPGRATLAWSDTASAARDLARNLLDARTAVLVAQATGERFGLALLAADVQDAPDSRTFFAVLGTLPAAPEGRRYSG